MKPPDTALVFQRIGNVRHALLNQVRAEHGDHRVHVHVGPDFQADFHHKNPLALQLGKLQLEENEFRLSDCLFQCDVQALLRIFPPQVLDPSKFSDVKLRSGSFCPMACYASSRAAPSLWRDSGSGFCEGRIETDVVQSEVVSVRQRRLHAHYVDHSKLRWCRNA